MAVLVTGGAGYIGTHTIVELINSGFDIVALDNLHNSKKESINRVKKITGKDFKFYKIDMLDIVSMQKVFEENDIEAVIHFAGYKAVGESVEIPLNYYDNNIVSTINLLRLMKKYECRNLIFSSSATVYGVPKNVPINEDAELSSYSPYGRTKLFIEQILQDISVADSLLNIALLRYFNPVGAHISGLIGEDPNGVPNNLVPYIAQVAVGRREYVSVYGADYNTPDGTGVRDYIHVIDLAKGHVKALNKLLQDKVGCRAWNLGTGKGYSVLDVIKAYSEACGKDITYKIVARREGDVAECYADCTRARVELGWQAEYDIKDMCSSSWLWQKNNPEGYE